MDEFCRYEIVCEYSGLFDDKWVVAYSDTLANAKMIVEGLRATHDDCLYEFSYERIAEFDEFLDTEKNLFDIC